MPTGPCTSMSLAYMHALWSMCFCVTGIYTLDQVPLCHIIYPLVQVPLCHWNINIHWSKYLCITCICPLVHVLLYHWHTFITTGPCTSVSLALYIYPLIHVPLCQWHVFLGPHTSMSVAFLVAWHLTGTRRCSCSMAYAWNVVHHMSGC